MTVETVPASWRKENNQYVVKRLGYLLFGFFELNQDQSMDVASKKTVVVTSRTMDTLLDLDTRASYNEADTNEELVLYQR